MNNYSSTYPGTIVIINFSHIYIYMTKKLYKLFKFLYSEIKLEHLL